jgi:hypothetical protein
MLICCVSFACEINDALHQMAGVALLSRRAAWLQTNTHCVVLTRLKYSGYSVYRCVLRPHRVFMVFI